MAILSVIFFILGSSLLLVATLKKKMGQYHLPFFCLSVSLFYIGVQLILFTINEGERYKFEITFFSILALLTNVSIYSGFYMVTLSSQNEPLTFEGNNRFGVFLPGIFLILLIIIGLYGFLQLGRMSGGLLAFITHTGEGIVWEGQSVYYSFFISNMYIIFPLSLFIWLKTNKTSFLIIAVLSLVIPIVYIFFLNRRYVAFSIFITIWLASFYMGRFQFSKKWLIAFFPSSLVIVNIFPLLRSDISLSAVISSKGITFLNILFGSSYGEVKNGVLTSAALLVNGGYGLGYDFFRQLIKDFVPSALVGRDFKNSLINGTDYNELVSDGYNFYIPSNEFITGISWTFTQFGVLSPVMWFFMSYFMAKQYKKSLSTGGYKNAIFYTTLIPVFLSAFYFSPGVALSMTLRVMLIAYITFFLGKIVFKNNIQYR